jgi:hypothetical protein
LLSSLISTIYIFIQSSIYPETFGTTSRYGSWTDDSYFFTLITDKLPPNFFIERDNYFEYNSGFATILKKITIYKIEYPIEVIFFQSGVMTILALSAKESNILFNKLNNNITSYLIIFCPFLYMNGGAILVRDVLVATLFLILLNACYNKNIVLAIISIVLEIYIRPGTAFILIILMLIFYINTITQTIKRHYILFFGVFVFLILVIFQISVESIESILLEEGVSVFGREVFYSLESGNKENKIYLLLLNQPIYIKLLLTGIYFYLYPWISFTNIKNSFGLDIRTIFINIIYPILNVAYNYFFLLTLNSKKEKYNKNLIIIYIVGLSLLGTYSLETRHKTILIPILYLILTPVITTKSKTKLIPLTISLLVFLGTIIISIFK